jgi:hypothetical protein
MRRRNNNRSKVQSHLKKLLLQEKLERIDILIKHQIKNKKETMENHPDTHQANTTPKKNSKTNKKY